MHELVNKYAKDHPQALRSLNSTEEPKCTLLMSSLLRTQWLHANCPSRIIICPCCGLNCAQKFGPHCVSTRGLIPEPENAFWHSLIWCFRTRPKIVKRGVYCLEGSSLQSHLYHSITNGQDLQFQPLTRLGTRKPFPDPGYKKLIFLKLKWVESCLEKDTLISWKDRTKFNNVTSHPTKLVKQEACDGQNSWATQKSK